jgi:hypothetical protein
VAAVNLSGAIGPLSKPVKATTAPNTQTSTSIFLGIDEKTGGNWPNSYGTDGFVLLRYFYGRDCQVWPDYLNAIEYSGNSTNRQFIKWNSKPESLLTSRISYCARYLGALETSSSNSLTLYVSDSQPRQLSLYVCDFDKKGRKEMIEIRDLKGRLLTPAIAVSDFEHGKWLRFKFAGSIQIHVINRNSESTAVLSALMFDKAS